MRKKELPNVGKMNRQMQAQLARVQRYVDGLSARMDRMLEAMNRQDWQEVHRISDFLASSSTVFGCPDIATVAENVRREASKPNNELEIRRAMIRMIGRYGQLQRIGM